jgi:hypothetical protein
VQGIRVIGPDDMIFFFLVEVSLAQMSVAEDVHVLLRPPAMMFHVPSHAYFRKMSPMRRVINVERVTLAVLLMLAMSSGRSFLQPNFPF